LRSGHGLEVLQGCEQHHNSLPKKNKQCVSRAAPVFDGTRGLSSLRAGGSGGNGWAKAQADFAEGFGLFELYLTGPDQLQNGKKQSDKATAGVGRCKHANEGEPSPLTNE